MAHWDPNFGSCDPGGGPSFSGNMPVYSYGYQNFASSNQFMQNFNMANPPPNVRTLQEVEHQQKQQYLSKNNAIPQTNIINSNSLEYASSSLQALNISSQSSGAGFNLNATAAEFKPMDTVPNPKGAIRKSANSHNEQNGSKASNKRSDNNYSNRRFDNRNSRQQNYRTNNPRMESFESRNQSRYENKPRYEYYNSRYDQNGYSKPSNSSTRNKTSEEKYKTSEEKYKTSEENYKTSEEKYKTSEEKYKTSEEKYKPSDEKYKTSESESRTSRHWNKEKTWESKRNNSQFEKPQDRFRRNNRSSKTEEKEIENWRSYAANYNSKSNKNPHESNSKHKTVSSDAKSYSSKQSFQREYKKKVDAASQRERLMEQIERNMLECLVCCERVRKNESVWNCRQCFHVLHLACVSRWARSSRVDDSWRCPACQFVCADQPHEYLCFCGAVANPPADPGHLAHSCGELCSRKPRPGCKHACTLLCHPGPCQECSAIVQRPCGCGATAVGTKCSDRKDIKCEATCGKMLNCELHYCQSQCHGGDCQTCAEIVHQSCFCAKETRQVLCDVDVNADERFECYQLCSKPLSCGNHVCEKKCHSGPCDECITAPDLVKTCPCGQTPLQKPRTSCLDPIICCDKICNRKLRCGQPSEPHLCLAKCHDGECPACPKTTLVRCRCGHMDRELPCKRVTSAADDARCEKKCTKKRLCGKHKCNQFCCIDLDHECPLPCNHQLTCGIHRCERTCHRGRCLICDQASFEELYCECGASVLYPPVPCGTRRPACKEPCGRPHPCSHPPQHTCHAQPECPPCTVFTTKLCHGEHESRSTIPCHQQNFSCGMPCGKELNCGRHKCVAVCHLGACPSACSQPCTVPRPTCGHGCAQTCHDGACPAETPCRQTVKVTCECGNRSSSRTCSELAGEYQRIATSLLADKMVEMQRGHAVDIGDIIASPAQRKQSALKTLECNDECRIIERNRRLAIGLQIRNPDLSAKLTPRYSDYMRQWARKDTQFCAMVHDKLTELVQLAKQSKQKSRSYSFECMNRDKRHFVHEYCEHFGCDSAAYDQEPKRNVVATAVRDKSWLPSISLLELLQRESGQRKVPGPIMSRPIAGGTGILGKTEAVSLKLPSASRTTVPRPATPPGEYVDYFNNPPE